MRKETINIYLKFLVCIIVAILGVLLGYFLIKYDNGYSQKEDLNNKISKLEKKNEVDIIDKDISKSAFNCDNIKINEDTKIIYEYYCKDSKKIKYEEEYAPYFMIGKSKSDLEKSLSLWEIRKFDEKEIVLRKNISDNIKSKYIIGVKDEFITVFYEEYLDGNNVKEITNIPIEHLPKEEQDRLKEGIIVIGEEELSRRLEDYGS